MASDPRRIPLVPPQDLNNSRGTPPPPDLISSSLPSDYNAFPDRATETPVATTTLPGSLDTTEDRRNGLRRNDSLDNVSIHLTDSTRPTSLNEFFQDFWTELKALIIELIEYGRKKTWKKKLMTAFLMISSALVFYDLIFGNMIIGILEDFVFWMTSNPTFAVAAFVAIFVVCTRKFTPHCPPHSTVPGIVFQLIFLFTVIMIPPTLLIFGAGYAFSQAIGFYLGIVAAVFSCFIGSCIGAIIAFLRSRYMMRDMIYLFSRRYPLVKAADRALKRNGFHIMLLLRLCPIIPFNGLNYCCGITGVKLEAFAFSLVGVLPFQIYTVIVGATTGSLRLSSAGPEYNNESQRVGWMLLIAAGCTFGIVALVYTWKLVKKELRKVRNDISAGYHRIRTRSLSHAVCNCRN